MYKHLIENSPSAVDSLDGLDICSNRVKTRALPL